MQKVSANQKLVRQNAASYEKIGINAIILYGVLLLLTYICMILPIVNVKTKAVVDRIIAEIASVSMLTSSIVIIAGVVLPIAACIVFLFVFCNKKANVALIGAIVSLVGAVAAVLCTCNIIGLAGPMVSSDVVGRFSVSLSYIEANSVCLVTIVTCLPLLIGICAAIYHFKKDSIPMLVFSIFSIVISFVMIAFFADILIKARNINLGTLQYVTWLIGNVGYMLGMNVTSLLGQLIVHSLRIEIIMVAVAIVLLAVAFIIVIFNPIKNKKTIVINASMNGLATVLLLLALIRLGMQPLASGETFSFATAALIILFSAAILYLNVFQYIKGYGKYGLTFVLPFFIVFAVFQLYPIIFTFRTSVTDAAGWAKVLDNEIIGFDNFAKLFDPSDIVFKEFWLAFGNTVIMWVFNFVPQISMALILASWFTDTRMRLKFQGGFKILIFMPNIITAATIGMLFMSLFNYPIAPVNTLLQNMGLLNSPFEFFRNMYVSRGIVSFIQWWMWYGNTMIVMIAGILGINPSLFEAALVDGCSSRQTFWKITLPLIKPILLYNLVTSLVGGLTMFDIPHMMTQGAPNNTTNTVARFIYMQGFTGNNNFNIASAASVVLFVIIVICSLIMSSIMKDREPKKARRAVK